MAMLGGTCAVSPLLICWRSAPTELSPSSMVSNTALRLPGIPVSPARCAVYSCAASSLALTRLVNSAVAFFFPSESLEASSLVTAARSFCRLWTSRPLSSDSSARLRDRSALCAVVMFEASAPKPTTTVARVGTSMIRPSLNPIDRSLRYPTSRRIKDRAGPPPVVGRLVTSPAPSRRSPAIGEHLQRADPDGSDLRDSTMSRKKEKAQPGTDRTTDRHDGLIPRDATVQCYR